VNDCNCTYGLAVAQAKQDALATLWTQALACGGDGEELAGGCIANAPPVGGSTRCIGGLCVYESPDGSCLDP
jgi:hypothetical protein